jgi:hypothetical protein
MTVLSRGARVRRGGRRPGWVLLTALLVLALGASSALVFTDRVELLKLAVILALWAAVAGAFVSVLYRRQSDADQSRVRDLKLVYDLQLDREISARREYELTVESQLRRELASELGAQAADDVAALRAELAALRTHLGILFDTDFENRPALGSTESEATPGRAYSDWARNGESGPVDWVASDRITSVRNDNPAGRADENSIIDVPEEPLLPPRQPAGRARVRYEAPHEASYQARYEVPFVAPPPAPEPRFEPRHRPPPHPMPEPTPEPALPPQPQPQPEPQRRDWQPVAADGHWLPPGRPGSHWSGLDSSDSPATPALEPSGRRLRARHYSPVQSEDVQPSTEPPPVYGESGRRARSRHSAEYRDYGVSNFTARGEPPAAPPPPPPAAAPPPPPPTPPPPKLAPAPPPEPASRHRGSESPEGSDRRAADTGGQSVADLLARLQVQPSGGGRRRRRDD